MYNVHVDGPRQLRKRDCLGCTVLLCLAICLTLLASYFIPSHVIKTRTHTCTCTCRPDSRTHLSRLGRCCKAVVAVKDIVPGEQT